MQDASCGALFAYVREARFANGYELADFLLRDKKSAKEARSSDDGAAFVIPLYL